MIFNEKLIARNAIAIFTILFFSNYNCLIGQANGIAYTAEYTGTFNDYYNHEVDPSGNVVKGLTTVTGEGTHSVLGKVTTSSIVHINEFFKNLVDFTETDQVGNSLIIRAVGRAGTDAKSWGADGIITGGTGKYLGASGTYTVSRGVDADGKTTWSAKGIIYLIENNITSEKEAIRKVIEDETKYFSVKDYENYSNTLNYSDDIAAYYVNEAGGFALFEGEQACKSAAKAYFADPNSDYNKNVQTSNWNIRIRGDVAWATYDGKSDSWGSRIDSKQIRVLEKVNGDWKISTLVSIPNFKTAKPVIKSSY